MVQIYAFHNEDRVYTFLCRLPVVVESTAVRTADKKAALSKCGRAGPRTRSGFLSKVCLSTYSTAKRLDGARGALGAPAPARGLAGGRHHVRLRLAHHHERRRPPPRLAVVGHQLSLSRCPRRTARQPRSGIITTASVAHRAVSPFDSSKGAGRQATAPTNTALRVRLGRSRERCGWASCR